MKAMVYHKSNPAQPFVLTERPVPQPQRGEVLLRVCCSSINAADYRSARYGMKPKSGVFGADVAGTIEATGEGVTRFAVGDNVLGDLGDYGFGGFAEYAIAPEAILAHMPKGLGFVQAAALPLAAVTALQGLRDAGRLRKGERVLLHGASGGVGTYAIQLAKWMDADVTAVCSGRNAAQAKALGADRIIDYQQEDFTQGPRRYDLVLAIHGSEPMRAYRRVLAKGGRVVLVGGSLPRLLKTMAAAPLLRLLGLRQTLLSVKTNDRDVALVACLAAESAIRPVIERTCTLAELNGAFAYVAGGHATGKVIVTISEPVTAEATV
jgi:NADPH:quinone reductase-like Zn-dependent oxidoreductase